MMTENPPKHSIVKSFYTSLLSLHTDAQLRRGGSPEQPRLRRVLVFSCFLFSFLFYVSVSFNLYVFKHFVHSLVEVNQAN